MTDDNPQIVKMPLLRINTRPELQKPPEPAPNKAILKFLSKKVYDGEWVWKLEDNGKETYTLLLDENKPVLVLQSHQFKNSRLQDNDVDRYKGIIKNRIGKILFK